MIAGFGNNVVSALAENVTSIQTTLTVMPDQGTMFAKLLTADMENSSNPQNIYGILTLTNAAQTVNEICHLTAVNGDVLTVVRGQEGTTARGWSLNDVVANFATRGSENCFVQAEQLQTGQYTAAVAEGSENVLAIQLPGTFFRNSSTEWDFRTPLIITPKLTNTGATTLQLTVSGRVLGAFPLYKGKNVELEAGDIIADIPIACLLDRTKTFFSVMNPVKVYSLGDGLVRSVNEVLPDDAGAVTLTAENVGAYPKSGGEVEGEIWSEVANNFRLVIDNKGTFWRFDGTTLYLMLTNDGDPNGGYNALRPLMVDFATGKLSTGHDFLINGKAFTGNGASYLAEDGNVYGSVWDGFLNQWVLAQINALNVALSAQITASIDSNNSGWVSPNFQLKNTGSPSGGWWRDSATGLIVQAGVVAITISGSTSTASASLTFPLTFPGGVISVVGNTADQASSDGYVACAAFQDITTTGAHVLIDTNGSHNIDRTQYVRYIAYGY